MLDRLYYKLSEAEEILSVSRDMLLRLEKAGLIAIHGEHVGRRVSGASLRALERRIEQGEDIWAAVKRSASPAPSAPKPTAKARSTKTQKADGGISPHQKTDGDSLASAPLQSRRPSWLKEIT